MYWLVLQVLNRKCSLRRSHCIRSCAPALLQVARQSVPLCLSCRATFYERRERLKGVIRNEQAVQWLLGCYWEHLPANRQNSISKVAAMQAVKDVSWYSCYPQSPWLKLRITCLRPSATSETFSRPTSTLRRPPRPLSASWAWCSTRRWAQGRNGRQNRDKIIDIFRAERISKVLLY